MFLIVMHYYQECLGAIDTQVLFSYNFLCVTKYHARIFLLFVVQMI